MLGDETQEAEEHELCSVVGEGGLAEQFFEGFSVGVFLDVVNVLVEVVDSHIFDVSGRTF